jgi:hypothetical protein
MHPSVWFMMMKMKRPVVGVHCHAVSVRTITPLKKHNSNSGYFSRFCTATEGYHENRSSKGTDITFSFLAIMREFW